MTEVMTTATAIDLPPAEPATVAAVRTALGTRRPPGARPGRRRAGEPDPRVSRLDLLGEHLAPTTATLTVMWLASTRRAAAATRQGYCDDLLHWAEWWSRERGGRLDLAAVGHADVTRWLIERQAAGDAAATITRRLGALSSLYRYAATHGVPWPCPITEDHRPRVQRGRHDRSARVLDPAELRSLTAAASDVRDLLVVALLVTDGLRVSELCGADDADVITEGRRCWLRVTRKGGRSERVALDPLVCDLVDIYRQERPTAPAGTGRVPLIADADGHPVDRWDITRMLRRLARAGGISDPATVSPHALRASAITELIESGRSVTDVQQWAGHAHLTTTMIYHQSRARDDRAAAMSADLAGLVTLPEWAHDAS